MSRQGKLRPRTNKNIKDFWNQEAKEWGDNPRVTIRDHYLRLLDINLVKKIIAKHKNVLDIGCGTGFSSLFYAEVVDKLIAADFAELMVEKAKRYLSDPKYLKEITNQYAPDGKPHLKNNLRFELGTISNKCGQQSKRN